MPDETKPESDPEAIEPTDAGGQPARSPSDVEEPAEAPEPTAADIEETIADSLVPTQLEESGEASEQTEAATIPLEETGSSSPELAASEPGSRAVDVASEETLPDETVVQTEFTDDVATIFDAAGVDLDATHAETSLKLPSTTGSTTGATRSTVASVVVRTSEVTYGHTTHQNAEYEIGAMLGEGGMGSVYRARQNSIDRSVALKMVKAGSQSAANNDKFLTEAVITGDLEHPNIVPIYDLGSNTGGDLFYAMKEVRGAPWKKKIDTASEDENLEVLHKVADAIAFSHSRGIIHRDLKPDNVMIGEFGEVLVMDWGLALPTGEFDKEGLALSIGPAGTPAYMAPEMAARDGEVGTASDIYLLGALLFRLATGKAPHGGKNARECLHAALKNEFVKIGHEDELTEIARKAMSTRPEDRFATAQDFQAALREYRSHAESRTLTERAVERLAEAHRGVAVGVRSYRPFERAIVSFEEAIALWDGNQEAGRQLQSTQLDYARAAFVRNDFDLACQQLDEADSEHAALLTQIRSAREEHDSRLARLQKTKRIAVGLAASIFFVVSVASLLLHYSWRSEQQAHAVAREQFGQAHQAIDRLSGISEDLKYFPRLQTVRTNLLNMVAGYYERLTAGNENAGLERELAQSLLKLGEVHALLQEHEKASDAFQRARNIADSFDESKSDAPMQRIILDANLKIVGSDLARGRVEQAEQGIISGREQLKVLDPLMTDEELDAARATLEVQHGRVLERKGDFKSAAIVQHRAAQLFQGSESAASQQNAALSLTLAGQAYDQAGFPGTAAGEFREAIEVWKELRLAEPDMPDYLEGLATSNISLANAERDLGQDPEKTYRQAVEAFAALVDARPEVPRYRFNRAVAQINLAWVLNRSAPGRAGLGDEAQALAVEATNAYLRLAGEYHEVVEYHDGEIASRSVLGEILRNRGEFELAAEMFIVAAEHYSRRVDESPELPLPKHRNLLAVNLSKLAQVMAISATGDGEAEQLAQAAEQFELAVEEIDPLLASGVPQYLDDAAWIHSHLADVQTRLGQAGEAEYHAKRALELRSKLESPEHLHNRSWLLTHSLVTSVRNAEEAIKLMEQATKVAPKNADYLNTLAAARLAGGDLEAARKDLSRAEGARTKPSPKDLFVKSIVERAAGEGARADELLREAQTLADETAPGNPRVLRLRLEAEAASVVSPPAEAD